MDNQTAKREIPLVVDLDGSFLQTDILHEGILLLLKKNPLSIFSILVWAFKGPLYLKKKIESLTHLSYATLPVNKAILDFIIEEKKNGRTIVLATASLQSHAQSIASVYPIFDKVYGSTETNLKGKEKLHILLKKFGAGNFDYIGDSASDLIIFESSQYAYLNNPSKLLANKTKKIATVKHIWKNKELSIKEYIKAIRAYQWIKNVLIFVPVITSHSFNSVEVVSEAVAAFFAFSFAASAGYIINDLLDVEADRLHPRKKRRPFASGRLSIPSGIVALMVLLASASWIAIHLRPAFMLILFIYFTTSFCYSFYFKKIVLYDVFILALLYSTRVIAGGLVTDISISFWLIAFSTFIFLSLAFVKRFSELMKTEHESGLQERGREYAKEDLNMLQIMGIASGFASVLVFSLYIHSPEVVTLYTSPKILWSISFLFLFWINRIWVITNRGKMTDDPIVFTIKDKNSYFIFVATGLIIWLAM